MANIAYFGFNNPLIYKRGVENVVKVQAASGEFSKHYYIFFDNKTKVFRWGDIICISVSKGLSKFIVVNRIVGRLAKAGKLIVHSHNYPISFFLTRRTDIFTVHDGLKYLAKNFGKPAKLLWLYGFMERSVYRRSAVVHFVSKFSITEALTSPSMTEKMVVIPNTAPLEELSRPTVSPNEKAGSKYTILSVRSIEERANIDLLFDAAGFFLTTEPTIEFIVVGKGPLLEHYRQLREKRKLTNVVMKGFVDDNELVKLYQACDLVLVTARYGEGFGLPIIEGYLFNKPVLGSDICAIPEVIIGEEYLFKNNVESLVQAIRKVIQNRVTTDFRPYYDQNFSFSAIKGRYSRLYDRFK